MRFVQLEWHHLLLFFFQQFHQFFLCPRVNTWFVPHYPHNFSRPANELHREIEYLFQSLIFSFVVFQGHGSACGREVGGEGWGLGELIFEGNFNKYELLGINVSEIFTFVASSHRLDEIPGQITLKKTPSRGRFFSPKKLKKVLQLFQVEIYGFFDKPFTAL